MISLRLLEHVHGHIAVLSAALVTHPALMHGKTLRRSYTYWLAPIFLSISFASGVAIYGGFRETLRQSIFIESATLGFLFERKEHLAFFGTLTAWGGFLSFRMRQVRMTHLLFRVAALMIWAVVFLGTTVAIKRGF